MRCVRVLGGVCVGGGSPPGPRGGRGGGTSDFL